MVAPHAPTRWGHTRGLYLSLISELNMDTILADRTVSMSHFKTNPAAVLREAKQKPVAVLNHNRPAFYVLKPSLFEAIMEELVDRDLQAKVAARLAEKVKAIEVDINTI
jgi:antitoxin StbD